MYYPYLFARRGELLAFRDIVKQLHSDASVIPVFEPVSSNIDSLRLALKAADKESQPAYVILNPLLGKFAEDNADTQEWRDEAENLVRSFAVVRPTYLAGPDSTTSGFRKFVKTWAGREIGVVLRNTPLTPASIATEVTGKATGVRYFLTGGTPSPSTLAALGSKNCVFVEDRFQVQPSNARYKGVEPFTGSHLVYKKLGYGGFGDYACLPGKFRDGGSLPAAVAIHLTFYKANREVFVEHFVSTSQSQADRDIPKKMREAITGIVAATTRPGDSFGLTVAVQKYINAPKAKENVGLQKNKRWSVAHHLDLMSGLLAGRFK
ncbi:sce7725 family protein [Paraburkholderia caribensis]|uniref:sce7725 family protein n=1 Tax=Paraburkholderia caribensis TaxID=75105 RepID=UPI00078B2E4B|nr:sce7725 family protein [Paraburkholderia caribensis]AMV48508.1 hypothetical protein ATN79_48565 [Paraburkholderia caribensis]